MIMVDACGRGIADRSRAPLEKSQLYCMARGTHSNGLDGGRFGKTRFDGNH